MRHRDADAAEQLDALGEAVDDGRLLVRMLVEEQVDLVEGRIRRLPVVLPIEIAVPGRSRSASAWRQTSPSSGHPAHRRSVDSPSAPRRAPNRSLAARIGAALGRTLHYGPVRPQRTPR
jgi:hypothetical protein